MPRIRIAIIESPNPIDLFEDRSEAHALAASCKLIGHDAVTFFTRTRKELQDTIRYLASSDSIHAARLSKAPMFLHISSHGNADGIAIGPDTITWKGLVKVLSPLIKNDEYSGALVVCLSSCGSGENKISREIAAIHDVDVPEKFPLYIFSILGDTVNWDDALIAWILLYHKISKIGIDDRDAVIQSLEDIDNGVGVRFSYSRFDKKQGRYFRWLASDKG